jgi:NADH dehydrogenase
MMSNTLITVFGGTGFVGRHTVRALARAGFRVRVAVRYPSQGFFLPPMGHVGQIAIVKCNVRNPEQIAAAIHGASGVVNLTGILFSRGRQNFNAVHVEGAAAIAKAAQAVGVSSLVHISAIGANVDAESSYAASKGEGERRVREAFSDATILRPSIVFGPEDDFFNRFAALARILPVLPLIGGGHTKFQPVFVGDVASAVLRALNDPSTRGKTYELGGPTIYTFKELMQVILRETCRKRLLLPIPFSIAAFQAFFLQFMPKPLLTPDQVTLLRSDNIVSASDALASLGIAPTSVEAEVPTYLSRFRPKGQYDELVRERVSAKPAPR